MILGPACLLCGGAHAFVHVQPMPQARRSWACRCRRSRWHASVPQQQPRPPGHSRSGLAIAPTPTRSACSRTHVQFSGRASSGSAFDTGWFVPLQLPVRVPRRRSKRQNLQRKFKTRHACRRGQLIRTRIACHHSRCSRALLHWARLRRGRCVQKQSPLQPPAACSGAVSAAAVAPPPPARS
jgi:hypothetical protein